jgi:hypothetical protein
MWLPISHHVENNMAPCDAFGEYLNMGLTPRKAIYLKSWYRGKSVWGGSVSANVCLRSK